MKSSSRIPGAVALIAAFAAASGCAAPRPQMASADAPAAEQCSRVTGSRIAPEKHNECQPVGYPFRSYSAQDLESTGRIDIGEALRQIDPAFR